MTGIDGYNKYYENKINKVIESCPMLKDFYTYLTMNKAEITIFNYLIMIRKFLQTVSKDPSELTYMDFLNFMQHEKYNRDGTEKTNSGAICTYHALKNYSTFLYNAEILHVNPMDKIERPKAKESQKTITKRENGFLTSDEIKQILYNVQHGITSDPNWHCNKTMIERDKAIIVLFLTTGIRASALSKIDLTDLDFKNRNLKLTEKGGKVRTYNLSETAVDCLCDWIAKRKEFLDGLSEEALFINKYKERLSYKAIAKMVVKYGSTIEGKHITPHKLRATYGTQLYEATKDIYFVQRAMGHTSPTTTEKYIRGQSNVTQIASNIMDELLKDN